MNAQPSRPGSLIVFGLILCFALCGCKSDPNASSTNTDGNLSATTDTLPVSDSASVADESLPTMDSALTEGTVPEDQPPASDQSRKVAESESEPPIPKPGDIDPTKIFDEPLEKQGNPNPDTPSHTPGLNQGDVAGCWTDSREEYSYDSGFKIFRPCEFKKFPASRFRFRMDLQPDGSCSWLWLAPNDGHRMKPGTWKFSNGNKGLTLKDEAGNVVHQYVVLEVTKEMLKLKKK